ncbi:MAG: DUF3791 domain-containing protein [Chitinispirillia bacterium]|nr:DUF3791 domain-containing protein [Chitinispirillia bacterium]MCL2268115.1 DUF3791 domain-containing protein [Chitinispirillia bacterium]
MNASADLGILSDESRYFIFLLERYALAKGITGVDALDLFEGWGIVDYIYSMYCTYHTQRTENAIDDIDRVIRERLRGELRGFVDAHYVAVGGDYRYDINCGNIDLEVAEPPAGLVDRASRLEDTFSVALIKLIQARGLEDAEVYKRAGIDRRHFSKIRSNEGYSPAKKTALALAVALKLTLDETRALLCRAGYSLSRSMLFDVIIEYFIVNGRYDIIEINDALYHFDQAALVGVE